MHIVLVGPEFEENLSLRYLAAALQQAGEQLSQVAEESARRGAEALARVADASPGHMNGAGRHTAHAAHEGNGRRAPRASA